MPNNIAPKAGNGGNPKADEPDKEDDKNKDDNENPVAGAITHIVLPRWQAVLCVLVGLGLLGVAIGAKHMHFIGSEAAFRFILCSGLGLVFGGFGFQMSGKIKSFNVAGGAGAGIVLLILWYQLEPPQPVDPAIEATLEGPFPESTTSVEIAAQGGRKLLGAWQLPNSNYLFRVPKRHVDKGCIQFVVYYPLDGRPAHYATTYMYAGFFKKFFTAESGTNAAHNSALSMNFVNDKAYIFETSQSETPVSFERCSGARMTDADEMRDDGSVFTRLIDTAWGAIISVAEAANLVQPQFTKLIEGLGSKNPVVRRNAVTELARMGATSPDVTLPLIRSALEEHKLQPNMAEIISEMANFGVAAEPVRNALKLQDIKTIAGQVGLPDRATNQNAAQALEFLRDPRAHQTLVDIATGDYSADSKYVSASVLNENFDFLSAKEKLNLKTEIQAHESNIYMGTDAATATEIQALLQNVLNYNPDTTKKVETGWVYIGTNFGGEWGTKYFKTDGNGTIPKPGDVLTATGNVNLRVDHIKFSLSDGWQNAPAIGTVKVGDQVEIKQIKPVAGGFYWAEIAR